MFSQRFYLLSLLTFLMVGTSCSQRGADDSRGCIAGIPCTGTDDQLTVYNLPSQTEAVNSSVTGSGNVLQCTADAPATAASGQSVTVRLRVSGGAAPYFLPNNVQYGSFSSEISAQGSFYNTGTTNVVVEREVSVEDQNGAHGVCYFRLTVTPSGSSSSSTSSTSNSCQITVQSGTPRVGVPTAFYVSAPGTYTIQDMWFQDNWHQDFNYRGSGTTRVEVTYLTSGTRTISALVNAGGQTMLCSKSVSVQP